MFHFHLSPFLPLLERGIPGANPLSMASFPNENPLGRRIKLKIGAESLTVVGVVADYHQHIYDRQPRPTLYVPYHQMPTQTLDLRSGLAAAPPR